MRHKHKGKHIEHNNMQQHIRHVCGRLEHGDRMGHARTRVEVGHTHAARTVTCPVASGGCNTNTKASASSTSTCNNTSTCTWTIGAWGAYGTCSNTCGSGTKYTRTRTVTCPLSERMRHKHKGKHIEHMQHATTHRHVYGQLEHGDHYSACSNTCGSGTYTSNTNSDMPSEWRMQHKHKGKHIEHINMQQHIDMCMDDWRMGRHIPHVQIRVEVGHTHEHGQ